MTAKKPTEAKRQASMAAKWERLKAQHGQALMGLFVCPSHQCNAACIHCYEKFAHERFKQELTTEQIESVIDQLAELGGIFVRFCSGEILLRDDCFHLIKYAAQKIPSVSLTTNGILLTESTIDRLKDEGLTVLCCSIDNASAEIHDRLRGVPGCFERATNGLRYAKSIGLDTEIWTYISRDNYQDLHKLRELGAELEVGQIFVFFTLLAGNLFNDKSANLTFEEREQLRTEYGGDDLLIFEFATEADVCSGGGLEHVAVMPSGDVTFCPPVPYSYGHIDSESLADILVKIADDHRKFCYEKCTGQCIVNFDEYRETGHGRFMYGDDSGD